MYEEGDPDPCHHLDRPIGTRFAKKPEQKIYPHGLM